MHIVLAANPEADQPWVTDAVTDLVRQTGASVAVVAVDEMEGEQVATPMPADVVARTRAVDGVAEATGLVSADGARVIGSDGKVLNSFGPPRLGGNWTWPAEREVAFVTSR